LIDQIIEYFGSQVKTAEALGVKPANVTFWKQSGFMPSKRAIMVERLSGGKFRAVDIPTISVMEVKDEK
jgi:DNA-binding transcriptional regulator YdaS (Cro superfamily)